MRALMLLVLSLCTVSAQAALVTKTLEYTVDGETFRGYLAYDDSRLERRPGVLVLPEWWGVNDYVKLRAEQLADMGYVAFVADMYGKGRNTTDPKQAGAWAGEVRGTPKMVQRAAAALKVLAAHQLTDAASLAAIGFCFGGTGVLELAFSGAGLAGVVSFHGTLPTPPAERDRIKAKVLVLHGAEDPFVKPEQLQNFIAGMGRTGADWHMVIYGDAVHAFTNPAADQAGIKGVAYNEVAAERAWNDMQDFFADIFAPQ